MGWGWDGMMSEYILSDDFEGRGRGPDVPIPPGCLIFLGIIVFCIIIQALFPR